MLRFFILALVVNHGWICVPAHSYPWVDPPRGGCPDRVESYGNASGKRSRIGEVDIYSPNSDEVLVEVEFDGKYYQGELNSLPDDLILALWDEGLLDGLVSESDLFE